MTMTTMTSSLSRFIIMPSQEFQRDICHHQVNVVSGIQEHHLAINHRPETAGRSGTVCQRVPGLCEVNIPIKENPATRTEFHFIRE